METEEDWRGNLGCILSDCDHRSIGKLYHFVNEPEGTHCQICEDELNKKDEQRTSE